MREAVIRTARPATTIAMAQGRRRKGSAAKHAFPGRRPYLPCWAPWRDLYAHQERAKELQRVLMKQPKYKPFKGLQFGGFILLVIGVFLGICFNEDAGTGVAVVGIVILWASRLLAWWEAR